MPSKPLPPARPEGFLLAASWSFCLANTDTQDALPLLIRTLSDFDARARETAASKIFARGRELARPAVERWLSDEDLARCFALGPAGEPRETVGVAVEPGAFERIRGAFGSPPLADVPPDLDALEFEIECLQDVRLDILTTREPPGAGAIAAFLRKFGEGIQQVELLARDAGAAARILRARFGIAPLFPDTRSGANGTRV